MLQLQEPKMLGQIISIILGREKPSNQPFTSDWLYFIICERLYDQEQSLKPPLVIPIEKLCEFNLEMLLPDNERKREIIDAVEKQK